MGEIWPAFELLLVAFMCTIITWYMKFLWGRRKLYQASSKLPGPLALPFIGSGLYFIGSPYDLLSKLMKLFNKHPSIFRMWLGPKMFYCISEPKHYKILLKKCLNKGQVYDYAQSALGHGLITAPYDTWKRHRKIIIRTFNQKILNEFVEIFYEQAEVLVDQMKKIAGKGEFDIFDMMAKCTVDTICDTAMGVKVNSQTTDDTPLFVWLDKIMEGVSLRICVVWYRIDAIFNLTSIGKDMRIYTENVHRFSGKVVKEKKKLFDQARNQIKTSKQGYYEEGPKSKVILDYLIEITSHEHSKFTEKELIDEINTLISAGFDTTASTGSFVFIMLGLHKDLQEKVYQEILEVVGTTRAVEQKDLEKLKYMEMFIKETLRLFPVASVIARAIHEDVDIGDHVLLAGTTVVFGILKTHTNELYWSDPYNFDPGRFLPEEVAKRHPCAYLPFSYGPRNCIGPKYAMMAMKALLATVIRKFKISTSYKSVQDVELKANLVLRPKHGCKVSLELR